jgi:hypothetical protein
MVCPDTGRGLAYRANMLLHTFAVSLTDKLAGHLNRMPGFRVLQQGRLIEIQFQFTRIEQMAIISSGSQ